MSYTAVVLSQDNDDIQKLFQEVVSRIPIPIDEWEKDGDHMTLNVGEPTEFSKPLLGKRCLIFVDAYGFFENKVLAARVEMASIINGPALVDVGHQLHITLAVSRERGGRSRDANRITTWTTLPHRVLVNGIVEYVKKT